MWKATVCAGKISYDDSKARQNLGIVSYTVVPLLPLFLGSHAGDLEASPSKVFSLTDPHGAKA